MEVKFTTDDPYEKRLFELFKNHQGKDQGGGLDRDGLVKLCMSLELRDRGEALVKLLTTKAAARNDNGWLVSFQDFRAGLLQILGEEMKSNDNEVMSQKLEKSDSLSDPETSDREIKPKFVVGHKKYGRRSRPLEEVQAVTAESDSDDEEEEGDDELSFYDSGDPKLKNQSSTEADTSKSSSSNKVKRSVSQSEMQESKRRRPISANHRLKRCASLPPQSRNIHGRRFVKAGKNYFLLFFCVISTAKIQQR